MRAYTFDGCCYVYQFDAVRRRIEHDVGRLDVAVNDTPVVQVLDRGSDPNTYRKHGRHWKQRGDVDMRAKVDAFGNLHHNVAQVACGPGLVYRGKVRMHQMRCDFPYFA